MSSQPVQAVYYTIFFFNCARLNSTYHFILIFLNEGLKIIVPWWSAAFFARTGP